MKAGFPALHQTLSLNAFAAFPLPAECRLPGYGWAHLDNTDILSVPAAVLTVATTKVISDSPMENLVATLDVVAISVSLSCHNSKFWLTNQEEGHEPLPSHTIFLFAARLHRSKASRTHLGINLRQIAGRPATAS